jgi:hypothetical protein
VAAAKGHAQAGNQEMLPDEQCVDQRVVSWHKHKWLTTTIAADAVVLGSPCSIAGLGITGFDTVFIEIRPNNQNRYLTLDFIAQAADTEIAFLNW